MTKKKTKTPTAEILSLDRFKSKRTAEVRAAAAAKPKPKKTEKPKQVPIAEPFVQLPFHRLLETYTKHRLTRSAWYLMLMLERLHFKDFHHKNPVHLTGEKLAGCGMVMPRNTKARALRDLQVAGLVSFTQTGNEAFRVTLSWHPVL